MAGRQYLDFDLSIEPAGQGPTGQGYCARVLRSPGGEASAEVKLPFPNPENGNFVSVKAAESFGGALFEAVFSGEVMGCLRVSSDAASRQGWGLRLRLHLSQAPGLADLPWEYLYDSARGRFLALSAETPIVRYLDLPERVRTLAVKPPLHVLVMIASPRDYPPLAVEREYENLCRALARLVSRGLLTLDRLSEPTFAGLQSRLRKGECHVFHFIGHGGFDGQAGDGFLVFENEEDGGSRRVDARGLGNLLDHPSLRLAVLNACEGARGARGDVFSGTAQGLVQQGVPAVIAMQLEVTDEAAITFSKELYSALADRYPVDAALAEARKAIFDLNALEWGTPVLYMRAPDGRIFDVEETGEREPVPAWRCMAQPPDELIHRREYDEALEALCPTAEPSAGPAGITVALWGAGGFGKSALAQGICFDERVREKYPEGILWATLGQEINDSGRLSRIRDLIRWWTGGESPAFESVGAAGARLRELLSGSRVLVVIDDVWSPADIAPFEGLGEGSALLITTRDSQTLPAGLRPVEIRSLAPVEALDLLRSGLPPGESTEELKSLTVRLGEWPLLLKLVNRQLRESVNVDRLTLSKALKEIGEALDEEGLEALRLYDQDSRDAAASRALLVSVRRLKEEDQRRYFELSIFSPDAGIPLKVLERFWGLGSLPVRRLCGRFLDLSLLLAFDREGGEIRLHRVFGPIMAEQLKADLPKLHDRLLAAYEPPGGRWAELPREEKYLWRNLAHHFRGAERKPQLRSLLLEISFVEARLKATDISALLADYALFSAEDPELSLIEEALGRSTHVLINDPDQLAPRLLGWLLGRQEEGIRRLTEGAKAWRGALWLRPRTASFAQREWLRIFEGHWRAVRAVSVLEGRRVLSGSADGTLRIWDLATGKSRILRGPDDRITALAVVDGRRAVSGSTQRALRVWDLETGQSGPPLEGHTAKITAVAVVDGRHVVSGSRDSTLKVWDLETGTTLRSFNRHKRAVTLVVVDGRRVISGSKDGDLRVWNVDTGQDLLRLEGHEDGIAAAAMIDGHQLVASSADGGLRVWNLDTGQGRALGGQTARVTAMAALDSHRAVFGTAAGAVELWDLDAGRSLRGFHGHTAAVTSLAVVDGRHVVSGSLDGNLRLWDLEAGQAPQPRRDAAAGISMVGVLDERRAVSSAEDGTTRVWDIETGEALCGFAGRWGPLAAVIDGRRAISHLLEVCDLETGETRDLQAKKESAACVAVVDPRHVIATTPDGGLQVWDLDSGQVVRRLEKTPARISTLMVLDAGHAVSGSKDGRRQVWDLETGELRAFKGRMPWCTALARIDDRRVVSSARDGRLFIWDIVTGQPLKKLAGPEGWVGALALLGGRRVVSASDDCTLRVWDLESGSALGSLTLDSQVKAVAVSRDGQRVIAGDQGGGVHFLDLVEPV